MSPSPTPGSPSNRAELIPRPDQPLPTGDAKVEAVRAMFDTIAPNYDKVNRIMTGRLDVRWRRTTVDALGLAPTSIIADLAAGTGDLVYELQDHGMSAIGVDLSKTKLINYDFEKYGASATRNALLAKWGKEVKSLPK